MRTVNEMADYLRSCYAADMLTAMRGPTSLFADEVEVRYIPPRSTDGWISGPALHAYQDVEAAVFRAVIPDAALRDVQVITRADDQIIVVMTLSGTRQGGEPFLCPATMVFDVSDGHIVRVVGLYDQKRMMPFADAFAEAAKSHALPVEMVPPRPVKA
jgi:ketosteroid isomerase-like protein